MTLPQLLKMIDDFGNMGTGEFVRNYPDCGSFEGYRYVQRKVAAFRRSMRSDSARDEGGL